MTKVIIQSYLSLWQNQGLVEGLLPVLADLSLRDAGKASLIATQALGCLINKLSDTSRLALLADLPLTPIPASGPWYGSLRQYGSGAPHLLACTAFSPELLR